MSITNFISVNKQHLALCIVALLLTISSFLIISMSLQTAYLWLIVVLMMLLFFTTFTCSNNVHWRHNETIVNTEAVNPNNIQQCWVIDVPPSYRNATGLPSGQTPPPCYRKLNFPPPPYEINVKNGPLPDIECSKHSLSMKTRKSLPDVFINRQTLRQNSVSSVQTLNSNM